MTAYLNKFNNQFHGIIALPLLAFSILYLEFDKGELQPVFEQKPYYVEVAVMFLATVVFILYLFRRLKLRLKTIEGRLVDKLDRYFLLLRQFYLMMTLPGAVSVVLMFLTGELGFSLVYILELFLLSIKRPSIHNIARDLRLSGEEKEIVLRKKDLIRD